MVFKYRLGIFEIQVNLVGIAHNTGLIFMAITGGGAGLFFEPDEPCLREVLSLVVTVTPAGLFGDLQVGDHGVVGVFNHGIGGNAGQRTDQSGTEGGPVGELL